MQLPPSPSEVLKEYRSRPPGSLPPLPMQVPEEYTKLKERLPAGRFCAIWMRGAFNVIFFQGSNAGYRQPIMQNCKLAAMMVSLQLVFGIFLTAFAFHTARYSPSLPVRDVPTWAGIPLVITGFFGILFVSCCHREYPGNCGVFTMKACSFCLSSISVIMCLCSAAFLGVHLVTTTTYTACTYTMPAVYHSFDEMVDYFTEPSPTLAARGCVCRVELEPRDRLYTYEQLTCEEVFTVLRILFVVMSVVSCLGAVASFLFTVLLWGSRYEHFYAGLRANEDAPIPVFK